LSPSIPKRIHPFTVAAGVAAAVLVSLGLAAHAPAELIVHYTFDADTGSMATDSAAAGGTTNATLTGGSFVTDAQRGNVLSMTGTGNNGAFGAVTAPSTTGGYTFAGWYKGTD